MERVRNHLLTGLVAEDETVIGLREKRREMRDVVANNPNISATELMELGFGNIQNIGYGLVDAKMDLDLVERVNPIENRSYVPGGNVDLALRNLKGKPLTGDELKKVEEFHNFLLANPKVDIKQVRNDFRFVIDHIYRSRITTAKRHVGLDVRQYTRLTDSERDKVKGDFIEWLKQNPAATMDDVREAGFGKATSYYPLNQAKKDLGIEINISAVYLREAEENRFARLANMPERLEEPVDGAPGVIVYDDETEVSYDPNKPFLMVGRSDKFQDMMERIRLAARNKVDTLVIGETGSGKKLVARYIHDEGVGRKGPFVIYNCSKTGLSEHIMLSELFGHRKGAFTGADQETDGYFKAADGGDLILEELQILSPMGQAALLDFFDYRVLRKLGGTRTEQVNVRLIGVTNEKLDRMVDAKAFRRDLYYRLKKFTIEIPPLRDRKEDVHPLAVYFLDKHSKLLRKNPPKVPISGIRRLETYPWPGNLRELESMMEESVVLGELVTPAVEDIERAAADLMQDKDIQQTINEVRPLEEIEKLAILKALEKTCGEKINAAALLGIGKSTLYRRLEEYKSRGFTEFERFG